MKWSHIIVMIFQNQALQYIYPFSDIIFLRKLTAFYIINMFKNGLIQKVYLEERVLKTSSTIPVIPFSTLFIQTLDGSSAVRLQSQFFQGDITPVSTTNVNYRSGSIM